MVTVVTLALRAFIYAVFSVTPNVKIRGNVVVTVVTPFLSYSVPTASILTIKYTYHSPYLPQPIPDQLRKLSGRNDKVLGG